MTSQPKFRVGFDRFIALEWAEFALELASRESELRDDQILELKSYLTRFMRGNDAPRKTANVLTRLWLDPASGNNGLRQQAISLYHETNASDHVCMHWGMSMIEFPLFRDTVAQMGRFIRIQGSFHRQEIHNRLLEKYGNHSTIPRCLDRIVQTLIDWQLLQKDKTKTYSSSFHQITSPKIQTWFLEASIFASPPQRLLLDDVYQLPELFPFTFKTDIRRLVTDGEYLRCERDGNNLEYVVVQR